MSWRVLITASGMWKAGQRAQELLRAAGCELVFPPKFGPLKAGALMPLLTDFDAVLASLDEYSAEVLQSAAAARLKIIARWGVGYDSIDLAAATAKGIVVTYTPGLLDDAVADYTFALLLALARRVPEGYVGMQQNQWKPVWGNEVSGKTLGIIGFGRIGQAVARRAAGFNMRLLAFTPRPKSDPTNPAVKFAPIETVLAESDYVSLHASLTPQSRGLIGAQQLRLMKPGGFLINTGRGALVDEEALVNSMKEGHLGGAALDVFTTEPLPAEHPFRSTPNLLLSPHQGSFTFETGEQVSVSAAQAIVDLMQGRPPENVLNPEALKGASFRT